MGFDSRAAGKQIGMGVRNKELDVGGERRRSELGSCGSLVAL
jgi:hypothetical protein